MRREHWAGTLIAAFLICGTEEHLPDRDADGIPDAHDPFPDDRDRPGQAPPGVVFAHSASTLYRFAIGEREPTRVGDFVFADGDTRNMGDIAIDSWGVMYAVAFERLYTCHPTTARCAFLREVGAPFNGLTVADDGTAEFLVGGTTDGRVFRLARDAEPVQLGNLPRGCSGDLYFADGRVWAAIDGAAGSDELVAFDPERKDPGLALPGEKIYGLSSCTDVVHALDESGAIFTNEGARFVPYATTDIAFWGAACRRLRYAPVPTKPEVASPAATPASVPPAPAKESNVRVGCACQ